MHYRLLGKTGLKVSAFGYGSWITFAQMEDMQVAELIEYAFDQGINFFDTAEVYGEGLAETKLGAALNQLSLPREKYSLCSKVFWGGNSATECGLTRKHIIEGCHKSLKRLKLDYLDMYLCHRPDPNVPVIETVIAMNMLINQGKIFYWGTSEWPNELILEAYHLAQQHHLIPPSLEQLEYSLVCRERMEASFVSVQDKTGIGVTTTMPLACGILAGRYNRGIPQDSRANSQSHPCFKDMIQSPEGKQKIDLAIKLENFAAELGVSLPQLALYWCLSNKRVSSVILGTNKLAQLKNNIETLELFTKLAPMILSEIDHLLGNKPASVYEPSYAEVIAES